MVRCHALCNETKVALNDRGGSFLNRPFANIGKGFATNGGLLRGLRGGPPLSQPSVNCSRKGALISVDLKTGGWSSAEAAETRAAARKAGSATLRMVKIRRTKTKRKAEE